MSKYKVGDYVRDLEFDDIGVIKEVKENGVLTIHFPNPPDEASEEGDFRPEEYHKIRPLTKLEKALL